MNLAELTSRMTSYVWPMSMSGGVMSAREKVGRLDTTCHACRAALMSMMWLWVVTHWMVLAMEKKLWMVGKPTIAWSMAPMKRASTFERCLGWS